MDSEQQNASDAAKDGAGHGIARPSTNGPTTPDEGPQDPPTSNAAGTQQPAEASDAPDGAVEDAPAEQANGAEDQTEDDQASDNAVEVDLGVLEALLFSTHHPLTAARLNELMELGGSKPLRQAIKSLNEHYASTQRSFRVEQVAGGYQMLTLPDYGEYLKKLHQREADARLTRAALETLAIIAYKQPILRADLEAIRGVASGETIRSLMEKHLVKIDGRAEEPGRPILYGTTRRFLELFGLNSLKDLPQSEPGAKVKREDTGDKAQAAPDQPPPGETAAAADAPGTNSGSAAGDSAGGAEKPAAASTVEDGNKD